MYYICHPGAHPAHESPGESRGALSCLPRPKVRWGCILRMTRPRLGENHCARPCETMVMPLQCVILVSGPRSTRATRVWPGPCTLTWTTCAAPTDNHHICVWLSVWMWGCVHVCAYHPSYPSLPPHAQKKYIYLGAYYSQYHLMVDPIML
jgi:hypothetical protein